MWDINDLKIFVRVVELASFSAAGRDLRLSTAVISNRIAKLESRLGVRLLNRTTRQVQLSETAQAYYQSCRSVIGQMEAAENELLAERDHPRGVLSVSVSTVFAKYHLAPVLSEFSRQYPDVHIRMTVTDSFTDLIGENIDLAIREAALKDSAMIARKLFDSHRLICATPAYLQKYGRPETPADLLKHNCLLLRFPGSVQFQWSLINKEEVSTIPVTGNLDSNNGDVLTSWLMAGKGLALKSSWEIKEELRDGRLVELLPGTPPAAVAMQAIYPTGRFLAPKTRMFIEFLRHRFGTGSDWHQGINIHGPPSSVQN